ncbi:hypothetical protein [Citrobacter phage Tr1]|nr:hypothetical protein [Citrobacter phage Tr1]
MKTVRRSELKEEDNYCPHCGGLVNFKECSKLLVSPPIEEYYCSLCHKKAVRIQGE